MKKILISLTVFSLTMLGLFQSALALEEHEYVFDNNEQNELYVEMTQILRCPKCQNNNVADSDAEIAKDFRDKIYAQVKSGLTKPEIKTYFTDRYGEFVNYETRVSKWTIWIGLIPILVLLIGFIFIFNRSKPEEINDTLLSEKEQKDLDDILNKNKKSR